MEGQQKADRLDVAGKILGLVVFAGGVVLLVLVFLWAYHLFMNYADAGRMWTQAPSKVNQEPSPSQMGTVLGLGALRILLLFPMGYLASLVAAKGLQLFGAARGGVAL